MNWNQAFEKIAPSEDEAGGAHFTRFGVLITDRPMPGDFQSSDTLARSKPIGENQTVMR